MKKTIQPAKLKLNLRSETVRELSKRLSERELVGVAGGRPSSDAGGLCGNNSLSCSTVLPT